MKTNSHHLLTKLYLKKYPHLVKAFTNRAKKYQQAIAFMRNPPQDVRIFEVNPPATFQTKRLTKDVAVLKQDYRTGYEMGLEIMKQWSSVPIT